MLCCDVAAKPGISVIFNAFHETALIKESVACLINQNADVPAEIIAVGRAGFVVENAKMVYTEVPVANFRRSMGASQAQNSVLVFLDDDCVVRDPQFLKKIWLWFSGDSDIHLMAGLYSQGVGLNYFAKAYNYISNWWVLVTSSKNRCENFLGGFFCIRRDRFPFEHNFLHTPLCGGEEHWLKQIFQSKGLEATLTDLVVEHRPKGNAFSFFRRAFVHGWNRQPNKGYRNYGILVRHPWVIVAYAPALALHFILVGLGALSQKIAKSLYLTEAVKNMASHHQAREGHDIYFPVQKTHARRFRQ